MRKLIVLSMLAMACFAGVSCEKSESVRSYEEVIIEPSGQAKSMTLPPMHPPVTQTVPEESMEEAPSPLIWTLPEGWSEEKGSGMRLATMKPYPDNADIVCTV